MDSSIINLDLKRWDKNRWTWLISVLFVVQLAFLFFVTKPLKVRVVYPSDPVLELPTTAVSESFNEWLALEDPMLFAAPGWRGSSGVAWLRKPALKPSQSHEFPPIGFLSYREARQRIPPDESADADVLTLHRQPPIQSFLPILPPPDPPRESKLVVEDLADRRLLSIPQLPVQYYDDAVRRTVVQAGLDPEGWVISSRVISSSGSKQADSAAVALARTLRFEPWRGTGQRGAEIVWGKLIFDWRALNSASTNAVPP